MASHTHKPKLSHKKKRHMARKMLTRLEREFKVGVFDSIAWGKRKKARAKV